MTGIPASQPDSWENEGQQLASLLDNACAVVVASLDANAAAAVAIGIARVQGAVRRVAIADLIGEAPALEALNQSDDPHGISDSFLYGVSLNRIAHQVNAAGSVFLMPSGTESVAHEAVYANDRWRRLAAGFQQVGALLVVVAVPGTPGFAELCGYIGALLPIGDTRFPMPPGVPILAPPPAPPPVPKPTPTPPRATAARAREAALETSDGRRRKVLAAITVLFAVAIGVGTFWTQIVARLPAPVAAWFTRTAPDTTAMLVKPTPMDSTGSSTDSNAAGRDTVTRDSAGSDRAGRDSAGRDGNAGTASASVVPTLANPADASRAARHAIFYTSANTRDQAMVDMRLKELPGLAVTPLMLDGTPWFRVFIGASPDADGAKILLAQLRARKLIGGGSITSVPYALRLEGGVAAPMVPTRLSEYGKRGILAYSLVQANGSATLYTGAFESPAQAIMLSDSLRALGLTPVLAYRTGRAL
jgi:hypothetical protein